MSQTEELLNGLSEEEMVAYTVMENEPHIVINGDRTISVPTELKRIAVQYDKDVETVTFDCPRYWDDIDMSEHAIYINYKRADGVLGSYIAENIVIDGTDDSIIHFTWTVSSHVSLVKGQLLFLVCIKDTSEDGNVVTHWNSELCKDMYVSEGLECTDVIVDEYPDVITQLIEMVNSGTGGDSGASQGCIRSYQSGYDYKAGDVVFKLEAKDESMVDIILGMCKKDHNSAEHGFEVGQYWTVAYPRVSSAYKDSALNDIKDTYATKKELNSSLKTWQKNTDYSEGDIIICFEKGLEDEFGEGFEEYFAVIFAECKISHNSNDHQSISPPYWETIENFVWSALCDVAGNIIPTTYATKKEVGDIEVKYALSMPHFYDYTEENPDTLLFFEHNSTIFYGCLPYTLDADGNPFILSIRPTITTAGHEASIIFSTGELVPPIVFAWGNPTFSGEDCDDTGTFIPQPNTTYELICKCISVSGYETPLFSIRVGTVVLPTEEA